MQGKVQKAIPETRIIIASQHLRIPTWTNNIAVSNLTKKLMSETFGKPLGKGGVM
jgi:hypothetical protein